MEKNVKQVKVDNWGIYFLQRLKHFFNRTDYCDLTLQFQDNAQLKVHRLVLSACTEYFELLERTCEMYEDCLVMPDDLQADVVVPIVNFMYTGQLEFHLEQLERLYQTSQVMNMPVLTKLLDAHRSQMKSRPVIGYGHSKRTAKSTQMFKEGPKPSSSSSGNQSLKRTFTKSFANNVSSPNEPKSTSFTSTPIILAPAVAPKKIKLGEPRPTRYDLPEELDENIFEDSFSHISYTSEPIIVHPETRKKYPSKKLASTMFAEASSSKKTVLSDIMESKRSKNQSLFEDDLPTDLLNEQVQMFQPVHVKKEKNTMSENIFDQMMDIPASHREEERATPAPKVTIENLSPSNSGHSNIDHAKIISEVLKKYPHLMKSKKDIKLKILNTSQTAPQATPKKKQAPKQMPNWHVKTEQSDSSAPFQSVLDSQEAAKLIGMGIENVDGPWICLICGTPGQALHFASYYKFRRHLVEVHKEKAVLNVCEYCGLKSTKRNYMLHHMYTKHGVEPPKAFHFPKCNNCSYIALSEALLTKHKMSHTEGRFFRCNVCPATFNSSVQLLSHIRATGHKYSAEKKSNLQCIYCLKLFLRESNLYAHIKTNHKVLAVQDGVIDDSDDEESSQGYEQPPVKFEPPSYEEYEQNDNQLQQYEIRPDGNIELVTKKKPNVVATPRKQKILNSGLNKEVAKLPHSSYGKSVVKPMKQKPVKRVTNEEFLQEVTISPSNAEQHEEIVMIDDNEYVVRDNQLILRKKAVAAPKETYILGDVEHSEPEETLATTQPMEFVQIQGAEENIEDQSESLKDSGNLNQQNLIVVSNEEQYKALMNSNHSIIYDENEANKTLTVLSTPHGAPLDAANIVANTQTNNVMIIQDTDYPLSVSQSVPVDNNIMVVYSHQNKPYQIITTQGLGGQYVQSSGEMTQNFQAIDESTPVVTDHQTVLIADEPAECWQNNIAANENIEENRLAIVEEHETAESEDSMTELPEVTVAEPNNIESSGEVLVESVAAQLDDDHSQTEMPMVVDESADLTTAQSSEEPHPNEETYPTDDIENTEEQILEVVEPEEHHENDFVDADQVEIQHSNEGLVQGEEHAVITSVEVTEMPETTVIVTTYNENGEGQNESLEESAQTTLIDDEAASQVSKPVENLANEWSEDENDTNEDNTTVPQENPKEGETEQEGEIEESIENIQQEMEKQMEHEIEETTDENESPEDELSVQEKEALETNAAKDPPPEKISSLLIDWEDNDSQDDSANGTKNVETEIQVTEEEEKNESNSTEPVNDEKLKSLVNDWDEEDEEKN